MLGDMRESKKTKGKQAPRKGSGASLPRRGRENGDRHRSHLWSRSFRLLRGASPLAVLLLLVVLAMPVRAAEPPVAEPEAEEAIEPESTNADVEAATGINGLIMGWCDDIFGTTSIEDARGLLDVQFDSEGGTLRAGAYDLSPMKPVLDSLYRCFQNFGLFLLFLFLGLGFFEDISIGQAFLEKSVRRVIIAVAAFVLMHYSLDIIYLLGNVGSAVIQKVVEVATDSDVGLGEQVAVLKRQLLDVLTENDRAVEEGLHPIKHARAQMADFKTGLAFMVQMLIPFLIAKIAGVVISVVCWARFLELTLYGMMSPVIVADFSKDGTHSSSVRAVKNVFSLALSGAIIMITLYLGHAIQAQVMGAYATGLTTANYAGAMWAQVVISLVQVGMVVRAQNIAKSVLGMG